jgi:quinol monooxygenase YgiN
MDARQLLISGASVPVSSLGGGALAEAARDPYVRVAEIEIDPAQLEAFKAAVKEEIESSVRVEPGILALYAVSDKDNPAHVIVFEMYADRDAYKAHLETPHFRKYKTDADGLVPQAETVPIALSANGSPGMTER